MASRETGGGREPAWIVLAAVLVAPIAFRALLLAERTTGLALEDGRGLAFDLAVSLLLTALLVPLLRTSRLAAAGVGVLWCAIHYANYEVVLALGSMASLLDVHFLARPAFLLGSAFAISHPLALSVVVAASLAPLWWARPAAGTTRGYGLAGLLLLLVAALSPWSDESAVWRQTHFLPHDVQRIAGRALAGEGAGTRFPDAPSAMVDLLPELASDLDGTPRLELPGQAKNVLLVILESVSGLHMQSLAADHGVALPSWMPGLDALASRHASYSTFFVHLSLIHISEPTRPY